MPGKKNRPPDFNSTSYYIEEVVRYHAQYESEDRLKDGYPPVVAEMLLAILISLRAIRHILFFCFGLAFGSVLCRLLTILF